MKLFRKADEMEMTINFKSMRLSWVFGNIALVAWAIISQINGDYPHVQITIILIQNVIFFVSQLYMTHKMTKVEKDKNEK